MKEFTGTELTIVDLDAEKREMNRRINRCLLFLVLDIALVAAIIALWS